MLTEQEIAEIFERVADNLSHPQIGEMVSRAERRGGQIRARHRMLLAAGSVLAAGAVVAAVTTTGVVPRLTGGPGTAAPAAASSPAPGPTGPAPTPVASPSASPAGSPTPEPTASPGGTTGPVMTTTQIMDDLEPMLPAGSTVSDVQNTGTSQDPEQLEFVYNDGQGAVVFFFFIEQVNSPPPVVNCSAGPYPDEGPRPAGALPQSCTASTLPDGSLLSDVVTNADTWGYYDMEANLLRPDGVLISVIVGNGTIPGVNANGSLSTAVVTRAVPPGSFAEWNKIAESPVWHL